jgi:hypothetical protein
MLTKDIVIDLIQILSDRQIQVRELRRVLEDGVVIAVGDFHRFVLDPGLNTKEEAAAINEDLGKITDALWTPEIVAARKKFIADQDERTKLQQAELLKADAAIPRP